LKNANIYTSYYQFWLLSKKKEVKRKISGRGGRIGGGDNKALLPEKIGIRSSFFAFLNDL
jgi:hypothetical protein